MGKNYEPDVSNVNIDSWKTFVANNESIEKALDICCSNIADMIANINTIDVSVPEVNGALGKLKTVPSPYITSAKGMKTDINTISDYMKEKALIIVVGSCYAEEAIKAYNNGTDIDSEVSNLFLQVIKKSIIDTGLYWVVSEFLAQKGLGASSFILGYGTDATEDGGNFVVGDAAKKLFGSMIEEAYSLTPKQMVWVNVGVGTAIVIAFTFTKDLLTDKGDITLDDLKRAGLDAAFAGLSYAEWSWVYGALVLAGTPGVLAVSAAAILAIPTTMLFDAWKDRINHDNIIHTFTRDGRETPYEIPANGTGEDGTFDVLIDVMGNGNKEYHIGDRLCSEHEYKDKMYTNIEDFLYEDTGKKNGEVGGFYGIDIMQNALDAMVECDTFEEGLDAYYEYYQDHCEFVDHTLANTLVSEYGFNFEEYYNYNHKR